MALRSQSGQVANRVNLAGGASQVLLAPNSERSDCYVTADGAGATGSLTYLKFYSAADGVTAGAPSASATDYDIILGAAGRWNGRVGDEVVWCGGVVGFQAGSPTGKIVAGET
jgi:hypothetical protein